MSELDPWMGISLPSLLFLLLYKKRDFLLNLNGTTTTIAMLFRTLGVVNQSYLCAHLEERCHKERERKVGKNKLRHAMLIPCPFSLFPFLFFLYLFMHFLCILLYFGNNVSFKCGGRGLRCLFYFFNFIFIFSEL